MDELDPRKLYELSESLNEFTGTVKYTDAVHVGTSGWGKQQKLFEDELRYCGYKIGAISDNNNIKEEILLYSKA